MIDQLLQPEIQQFILAHEQDDEKKLVLQKSEILGVPTSLIAEQIVGRRKAKTKLPFLYREANIVYPPGLNLEQSSSEKTAMFKASIVKTIAGSNAIIADLTGGFGIDSYYFSKVFKKVFYIEQNGSLLEIARHNHQVLKATNIEHIHSSAENFLRNHTEDIHAIYVDPSRRTKINQKVFRLSDCEPDVPALLPGLFQKANHVWLKASPLLDIHQGIKELSCVEKVYVISVSNECKELIFICTKDFIGQPQIVAINLSDREEETFTFTLEEEASAESTFSAPLLYLYEPNASILKAGAFKLAGKKFLLKKIQSNTHLYTSENLILHFPGRVFKIIQSVKPDPKILSTIFPEGKANVITRNHPLTPEELKKKTRLKDGGEFYLIGFSGQQEKFQVAAERIK